MKFMRKILIMQGDNVLGALRENIRWVDLNLPNHHKRQVWILLNLPTL